MLARLMSLLFCSALQQVSPEKDRPFEIIDSTGIDSKSLDFLGRSSDRVEVILQWIQRSIVLNMELKRLPIAPPLMSRAFQEISRGIVNLQNARNIAEFPFPFPTAQTSMVMLVVHWAMCPILASMLLKPNLAALTCFSVIFFLWGINFTALQLGRPSAPNPTTSPWTKSRWIRATLITKRANNPPTFFFDPEEHRQLRTSGGLGVWQSRPLGP